MSDQNAKKKGKSRIFLTMEPEKRALGWFVGIAPAKNTARTVRKFQDVMLHGDDKHRYWAASLPQRERATLARRIRVEAFIYIGIGLFLGGSAFVTGVSDGLSGKVPDGLFWLLLGFLASLIGFWVSAVKFWQAHNVCEAAHIGLHEWLHRARSGDADGG